MARIFNSIRQRLLAQNRFTRYLIYAIGEIVLVVIGILIALQINNWNQGRISRVQSSELLKGMIDDLDQDLATLDRSIGIYESRLAFFERHLSKTDFNDTPTDTLHKLLDGSTVPFAVTDLSYEKSKNLGITQLCTNDPLALRINKYYTETLEFTKMLGQYEVEEITKDNDYWMKNQRDIEVSYDMSLSMPILQDPNERRNNIIKALMSPQGRNYIRSECFGKEMMLKINQGNRETVISLQQDIRDYLKVNN